MQDQAMTVKQSHGGFVWAGRCRGMQESERGLTVTELPGAGEGSGTVLHRPQHHSGRTGKRQRRAC